MNLIDPYMTRWAQLLDAQTFLSLTIIQEKANELIAAAERLGVVVTVEQVTRNPPAMGRYYTVAKVRPAHNYLPQEKTE